MPILSSASLFSDVKRYSRIAMAGAAAFVFALGIGIGTASKAAKPPAERIQVTGELIDSWCYVSQVMGISEGVTGSAHRQCAVWCAVGGIPVALLDSETGEMYMILRVGEASENVAHPRLLDIQSHQITADGTLHKRDGVNYIFIDEITGQDGLVNQNHDDWGVIPAFGVPKQ